MHRPPMQPQQDDEPLEFPPDYEDAIDDVPVWNPPDWFNPEGVVDWGDVQHEDPTPPSPPSPPPRRRKRPGKARQGK